MIFYAISVVIAVGVCGWAMALIDEYNGLSFEPIGSVFVAAAGFAVFPIINIFTTLVLVIMCLEAQAKYGKDKK